MKIIKSINDVKPQQQQQMFQLPRMVIVSNEPLVDPKTGKITHEALIYKNYILVYKSDAPDLKEWTDSMGFTKSMLWIHEEDYHVYQGFHTALYEAIQQKKPHTVINQIRINCIEWIDSVRDKLMEGIDVKKKNKCEVSESESTSSSE